MAEIIACPSCQRKLQVPEDYFGKTVQCPECKQTFTAAPASGISTPPASSAPPPTPPPLPKEEKVAEWEKRPKAYEDDDRPRRRRDEEDDDRPSRRRRDEDDDDDIGERRRRRYLAPHRGGMILTLGILSFFFCGPILGPMAWVMGNTDLNEIRSGRMDPEGEGMTQAGRILGMIATILTIAIILLYCVIFIFAISANGGRRF